MVTSYERMLIEKAPKYMWHLTCDHDFEIDPEFVPTLAYGSGHKISSPGIFLSDRPNYWAPWTASCKELYAVKIEHSGNLIVPSDDHPEFIDISPELAKIVDVLDIKTACEKHSNLFDAGAFQVYEVDATDWGVDYDQRTEGHTRWPDAEDTVFSDIQAGDTFVWLVEYFRAESRSADIKKGIRLSKGNTAVVYEKIGSRKYRRVGELVVESGKYGTSDEAFYTGIGKTFEIAGDVGVEAIVPVTISEDDEQEDED